MKLSHHLVVAVLAGSLLLIVDATPAADTKADPPTLPALSEEQKQAEQDVEDLTTAFRLAEVGEKQSAPEMLLSAAFLMRKLAHSKMQPITDKPTVELTKDAKPDDKPLAEEGKALNYEVESDKLIERAREIAAEKKLNVEPLIKELKHREIQRKVVGGPRHVCQRIGPHQVHAFQIEVEEIRQFTYSFRSTSTVRFEIIHAATGTVHVGHTHTSGGGRCNPGRATTVRKTVVVTVRIINITEKISQYDVWLQ